MNLSEQDRANRDVYLAVSQKLLRLTEGLEENKEAILDAIASMGPSDFLSDLTTGQLSGAALFLDWIIDTVQFSRGEQLKKKLSRD